MVEFRPVRALFGVEESGPYELFVVPSAVLSDLLMSRRRNSITWTEPRSIDFCSLCFHLSVLGRASRFLKRAPL